MMKPKVRKIMENFLTNLENQFKDFITDLHKTEIDSQQFVIAMDSVIASLVCTHLNVMSQFIKDKYEWEFYVDTFLSTAKSVVTENYSEVNNVNCYMN